jgi:predicted acylesterase/phospholipase RssA
LQIGALRALFEGGIQPDLIVGTSIGAWNGAALALDPTLAGIRRMEEVWRSATLNVVLLGRETAPRRPLRAADQALVFTAARRVTQGLTSLYGNTGVAMLAERYFEAHTFADLQIPILIVASSLTSGARSVFSSGPLGPAILASSAIPGIFPAVSIDDEVYVDGAAIDNVNLDVALDAGAQRLFILDIGYVERPRDELSADATSPRTSRSEHGRRTVGPHPLAMLMERSMQLGGAYRAQRAIEGVPAGIETHVLRLTVSGFGTTFAFDKASEWMDAGYRAACEQLPALVTR